MISDKCVVIGWLENARKKMIAAFFIPRTSVRCRSVGGYLNEGLLRSHSIMAATVDIAQRWLEVPARREM